MNLFECCKNCTDRHAKCHGTCEQYLKDRAELDEINSVRRSEQDIRSYQIKATLKNVKKNSRNKNKKGWVNNDT